MAKISVIGTGYVGLVSGACLSDFGHDVICVDNNKSKIKQIEEGVMPIYEKGLEDLVERNVLYKRLSFTSDTSKAVRESDVIFIAVGTPQGEDGSVDLSQYNSCIDEILPHIDRYKIIVNKSTVPVGTANNTTKKIKDYMSKSGKNIDVDIVSNPEFLREGTAIYDFTHQDRVVLGSDSEKAISIMKDIYRVLYINETPFVVTNFETAELIKYATNAFLATKISFINEMANLCDKVGANVQVVAKTMGKDGRINPKFLHAGAGYGGSCFPKDTRGIVSIAAEHGVDLSVIKSTISANEKQKSLMSQKIMDKYDSVSGKCFCILGLSFKPNTDDARESASITIVKDLIENGATVKASDPEAIENFKSFLQDYPKKDKITYFRDEYEAMDGCDGLVIVTQWNQYRMLDLQRCGKLLKGKILFDLRNIYYSDEVEKAGFEYVGVGQN